MGERAGDRHRLGHGHTSQLAGQRVEAVRARGRRAPPLFRERAHGLDALEQRLTFLLLEHIAEELAKQAHVVSDWLVRVFEAHRTIILHCLAGACSSRRPRHVIHASTLRHRHRGGSPRRLAAPQVDLRSRHRARRRLRGAALRARPDERRLLASDAEDLGRRRRHARPAGRGPDPVRLPRRRREGRARPGRGSRRLRAGGLLLDDQPAHAGARRGPVDRRRAAADGRGHRPAAGRPAVCRKLREVTVGDKVVCGLEGIRVTPEFRDRERSDFSFMSNEVSSERRVEASVSRIAKTMRETKARGARIVFVAGPVVIHTGGVTYFGELIRRGYVDVAARRQRARGARRRAGALRHLTRRRSRGRHAGSRRPSASHARDQRDQPGRRDPRRGRDRRADERHHVRVRAGRTSSSCSPAASATTARSSTRSRTSSRRRTAIRPRSPTPAWSSSCRRMLHGIGVGNMLPAWVPVVCVDINPAVVTKLADRGSSQTVGLVTDVGLFLHQLVETASVGFAVPGSPELRLGSRIVP